MTDRTGILKEKLKTYYKDVNLKDYLENLLVGMREYNGGKFDKILDIGSGVGSFGESISKFHFEIFCLEASEYGVSSALKKGLNVKKFLLKNYAKLPFKDNHFSLVVMNQVIEHVNKETGQFYINEIIRVLEPGGVCIIKSPSKYSKIWQTDPHHVYCWKPNELFNEISKYSESIESIKMERTVLEPWMFFSYNENIINHWHKKNKNPKIKWFLKTIFKILDKTIGLISNTDKLLSVSNITFVKK